MTKERRYMRIREIGCLACRSLGLFTVPEVHHLNGGGNAGQKRRGDQFTIGLCTWHHQGRGKSRGGPPLTNSREFRRVFGTDDELLAEQNRLIDCAERAVVR